MSTMDIQYRFRLNDDREEVIELHVDPVTLQVADHRASELPDWTRLEFHQCPHCPLRADRESRCPAAASLADVVHRFENLVSYDEVELEVTTAERRISQRAPAQRAISSLLGLLLATSGC